MNPDGTSGLRILVVEDNEDCAESMATLLRICGHEVEIAADGPTALEMAPTCTPDVVLLDIGLPRISGYDVARQLSAPRPGKTPLIIAVTGREEDRLNSAEIGIDLHLVKPVDPKVLQAILVRFQRIIGGQATVPCNRQQDRANALPASAAFSDPFIDVAELYEPIPKSVGVRAWELKSAK